MTSVRPLDAADAPELLPLVRALAEHHGDACAASEGSLARDLGDGWVVGFAVGAPMEGYALAVRHANAQDGERGLLLHHLFVAEAARRRGHARALLAAVEAEARAQGCAYVTIGANRGNEAARAAYVAAGYDWREATFWRFRKALAP